MRAMQGYMMEHLIRELQAIKSVLEASVAKEDLAVAKETLYCVEKRAHELNDSWSQSWIGFHANLYYMDFTLPPAGDEFDIMSGKLLRDQPMWVSYAEKRVTFEVMDGIDTGELKRATALADSCRALVENNLDDVISILQIAMPDGDHFLGTLLNDIKQRKIPTEAELIHRLAPNQAMTRDQIALAQGLKTPPHIAIRVRYARLHRNIDFLASFAKDIDKAAKHLGRRLMATEESAEYRRKVFIGHGHSPLWRELKDFLEGRLGLEWDEFDRVPTAGMPITERLGEMLDNATFAFLILTAEDDQLDGSRQARMNVIHEAGLFQGRLGFDRAIILLEEGCVEFSNIHGLVQIRFAKGNIASKFEEIRRVLEDRGILAS